MGSYTWGSGTDIFGVDYLDAQVPNSGSTQWQSNDVNAHMLSALELKRMSGHFEAGIDKTTNSSTPEDTPLSLKQEGASSGYYRTIHYSSQTADNYFFSQNVLMYDRHIITNVSDIQRLVWKPTITIDTFANASMVDGTTRNITCYSISQFEENKVDILKKGKTDEYTITGINIIPAIISPDSANHLQGFNYWGRVDERATWVDRVLGRYNQTYGSNSDNVARYCPVFGNGSPIILPNSSGETSKWAIDDTGNYAARFTYKAADQYSYLWTTYCNVKYWVCSEDELLHVLARSGLKFEYNNTIYKPVAENGVITGYTDDMDKESEWDNWHDYTDHEVPITPPSGGGGTPGEWDDMPGAGSSIGALAGARCYICSKTDITNLKNWMSKTEGDGGPPDGYDVLSSLISVMAFPIDMTSASSGPATAISFTGLRTATDNQLVNIASALLSIANSVGATPKTEVKTFTSTATALPSAGSPFTIDLGTCTCPTFYSSDFPFADYDASVELYLPFIGTMSLDTQTVMGNSLHAYMSVDPITGAIYAWCECTKNGSRVVVASGAGAIGVNTPITANQVGMAMAQIKNNAAQSRQTAIQSALTLGVGAFAGMDKNISSILSRNMTAAIGKRSANMLFATAGDYADALSVGASQAAMTALPNAIGANLNTGRANRQIAQANHNSVSGSAGGSTADWSCSYTPYLKIITPDVHRAGEQYEHTYGIPTILSGTLSTFKGLTFCANPDVSSISTATDQEKQQIFGLLAGGVYV